MKFPSPRAWLLSLAALISLPAFAQDDGLLPVTQAFHLTADASKPGVVKLHWTIAPNYYLYRGQLKIKATDDAALKLGEPQLPDGVKHHDEFLGDVETYHGAMDATVPYTLTDTSAKTIALTVRYQGCHEVEPKICYPPNTEKLNLTIGAPPVGNEPGNGCRSPTGTALPATAPDTAPPPHRIQAWRCWAARLRDVDGRLAAPRRKSLPLRSHRHRSRQAPAALDDAQGLLPLSRQDRAGSDFAQGGKPWRTRLAQRHRAQRQVQRRCHRLLRPSGTTRRSEGRPGQGRRGGAGHLPGLP